jgi:hypothetical protein
VVGRASALLGLFLGLVVYYETNAHWWQAGLWWDVAFIACVLMPAVFGLVLVGVPWWSARWLFPIGIAFIVLAVVLELVNADDSARRPCSAGGSSRSSRPFRGSCSSR